MEITTDYSNVKWQENDKLKLLIIVGTRPEIIRLAAVINKCRKYFDCILAHTGQNYDYNLCLKPLAKYHSCVIVLDSASCKNQIYWFFLP